VCSLPFFLSRFFGPALSLPCPALPCPALPCPALPCPALPPPPDGGCPVFSVVCSLAAGRQTHSHRHRQSKKKQSNKQKGLPWNPRRVIDGVPVVHKGNMRHTPGFVLQTQISLLPYTKLSRELPCTPTKQPASGSEAKEASTKATNYLRGA
jgi:hypothetical protein